MDDSMEPRWLSGWRLIAGVVALLYFANSALVSPGSRPELGEVVFALVTMLLWFAPWLWFRAGWIWWPLYAVSVLISVGLVWTITAAWVMQVTHPDSPIFAWPLRLQYLFLSATVFGLFSVWQTAALAVGRAGKWLPRRKRFARTAKS